METSKKLSRGPMVDILQPGEVGSARLELYRVTPLDSLLSSMSHRPGLSYCPEGDYMRLIVGGQTMMSDTPTELRTNWDIIHYSRGSVLIAGLGMGAILPDILSSDKTRSVYVIERLADVIALVAPQLRKLPGSAKLSIMRGDIMEWRPRNGAKFDTIYFDIWPDICTDNLESIRVLHQRFKTFKNPGGWMDSWMADYLRSERRADRRRESAWGY